MSPRVVIVSEEGMTAQQKGFLKQVFQGEIGDRAPCEWCGGLHQRECGRIRRMVFHPSGERVAEIEFWADDQWDKSAVIWPEDVFE